MHPELTNRSKIWTGVSAERMPEGLKKFFKNTKVKVAASIIGGALLIVLALIIIWLFSPSNQDKTSANSETRKGLSDPSIGSVNNGTDEDSENFRKPNGGTNEEETSYKENVNSVAERNNQVNNEGETDLEVRKPDSQDSKDWKADFETALYKFIRDGHAAEIPSLTEALNIMLEESREFPQSLSEYLKKNYETKRDTALGAKVAGEKDLNDLRLLLQSLKIVYPSYTDELLEVQFARKFVPPFLEPFQKLESKVVGPEDAEVAMEAKRAFPLAQIFSNLLLHTTASMEVRDKLSHDSFKSKSMIAILENLIPKLVEEAKDVSTKATALNYIQILRLLNPKSRYAFEGIEALDEIRQTMHRPSVLSYFVLEATQRPSFLSIDSARVCRKSSWKS